MEETSNDKKAGEQEGVIRTAATARGSFRLPGRARQCHPAAPKIARASSSTTWLWKNETDERFQETGERAFVCMLQA
jgi:hypothetical protein